MNTVKKMMVHIVSNKMKNKSFFNTINRIKGLFGFEGISYSQNNEDLVIMRLLNNQRNGFYLDIGAHDPVRFSNTFQLYLNGWSGINIDPLPGCMEKFNKYRPNDINLNIGISSTVGNIKYYNFEEPAYNTTDVERAKYCIKHNYTKLKNKIDIKVDTLENVLTCYSNDRIIDFMNLDVESRELDVLKSNDWDRFRPKFIAMESLASKEDCMEKVFEDEAIQFLLENDYKVIGKVAAEVFLKDWRN